jgi:hypothetical protein
MKSEAAATLIERVEFRPDQIAFILRHANNDDVGQLATRPMPPYEKVCETLSRICLAAAGHYRRLANSND